LFGEIERWNITCPLSFLNTSIMDNYAKLEKVGEG
jgi:hypothetical protein